MVRAWYMDDSVADQRLEHKTDPPQYVSLDDLSKDLGVLYWKINPTTYKNDPELEKIKKTRGYTYEDMIEITKEKLPNYDEKLKIFFEEHLHADEEIRNVLDGSGYFDVRDKEDRWIRILVEAGDLIILPAGIYHRFTLDTKNYIKVLRLFVGQPVWTPHNRPADDHPARIQYLQSVMSM